MPAIRPELNYSLTVTGENMQARLYVNGAPLFLHGRFEPIQVTVPITDQLQPGRNEITVDYEPFDMEAQAFTPHAGVALQIYVRRQSNALLEGEKTDEMVHLFSGRFDPVTGKMQALDQSAFGQGPLMRKDGGLQAGPSFLAPVEMVYTNRVSDGNAMRLSMELDITDTPMSTPPWIGSPALSDTPALRAALAARYRELHSIISHNAETDYRRKLELVNAHLALTLGYKDAGALADAVRSRTPLGPPPGAQLAPLPADLENMQLEFGSDARLVRFAPDPIAFVTPEGDEAGGYGYFFCGKGEALEVCFMQDIPY